MTRLIALAWLVAVLPVAAQAGQVDFKPGALKQAIDKGETVLLHYKSTW